MTNSADEPVQISTAPRYGVGGRWSTLAAEIGPVEPWRRELDGTRTPRLGETGRSLGDQHESPVLADMPTNGWLARAIHQRFA